MVNLVLLVLLANVQLIHRIAGTVLQAHIPQQQVRNARTVRQAHIPQQQASNVTTVLQTAIRLL